MRKTFLRQNGFFGQKLAQLWLLFKAVWCEAVESSHILWKAIKGHAQITSCWPLCLRESELPTNSLMHKPSAWEVSYVEPWANVRMLTLVGISRFLNLVTSDGRAEAGEVPYGKLVSWEALTENGISFRKQNAVGNSQVILNLAIEYHGNNKNNIWADFCLFVATKVFLGENPVRVLQQRYIYITWVSSKWAVIEKNLPQAMMPTCSPLFQATPSDRAGLHSMFPCWCLWRSPRVPGLPQGRVNWKTKSPTQPHPLKILQWIMWR